VYWGGIIYASLQATHTPDMGASLKMCFMYIFFSKKIIFFRTHSGHLCNHHVNLLYLLVLPTSMHCVIHKRRAAVERRFQQEFAYCGKEKGQDRVVLRPYPGPVVCIGGGDYICASLQATHTPDMGALIKMCSMYILSFIGSSIL